MEWYQEVTDRTRPLPLLFLVLGTKNDLQDHRLVTRAEGQRLADDLKSPYLETSARTGSNISAALSLLCRELLKAAQEEQPDMEKRSSEGFTVEDPAERRKTCTC